MGEFQAARSDVANSDICTVTCRLSTRNRTQVAIRTNPGPISSDKTGSQLKSRENFY